MQSNYALQPAAAQPVAVIPRGGVLTSFTTLAQMMEVANVLASSALVPKHFQRNAGSVMIALNMAQRLQMDPFMIMQNIYVVNGSPSMSGQFAIAMLSRSPKYKEIEYCFINGRDYKDGMYVKGHRADNSPKPDKGTAITPEIVRAEGWLDKNGSKWQTMPEQMYRYRAASWFARAFCPDELMGMHTSDELEDAQLANSLRNVTPTPAPAPSEDAPAVIAAVVLPKAKVKTVSKDKAEVQAKAVEKAPAPEPSVAAPAPAEATPSAWKCFLELLAKYKMSNKEFRSWCAEANVCLPPAANTAKEEYALWFFEQSELIASLRETYGSRVTML